MAIYCDVSFNCDVVNDIYKVLCAVGRECQLIDTNVKKFRHEESLAVLIVVMAINHHEASL